MIELLKAIKQNTFNTVEAVKEASNKISTVNSTIQNNTVNQTNVNNNNQNDQNKQNNSLQNQLTTESSDKVNNAYFKAMQIAKGRRR